MWKSPKQVQLSLGFLLVVAFRAVGSQQRCDFLVKETHSRVFCLERPDKEKQWCAEQRCPTIPYNSIHEDEPQKQQIVFPVYMIMTAAGASFNPAAG